MPLLLDELLARVDANGVLACVCGREHRIALAEVSIGPDALRGSVEILRRRHGPRPALWVLSDENTEAAAGARWKSHAQAKVAERILPATPWPVPAIELTDELTDEVRRAAPDLLVAVGSGVISDLVKKVSLDSGVPSWSIATAPSVDAYSSANAALHIAGHHRAVPARPSEVIICDLEVMLRAPRPLILAGLGDLLGKFFARLDWNLAHLIAGDPFCPTIADLAVGSAREALAALVELDKDPLGAMRSLAGAILLSGFAMQAAGNSRPAASAEHTVAHFWETTERVRNSPYDLHGILVGAAGALLLPGYVAFYRRLAGVLPDAAQRLAAYDHEPPWSELAGSSHELADTIARETRARAFDRTVLASRLEAFAQQKQRIILLAEPLLAEVAQAIALLEPLGFPFSLESLGIPEPARRLPLRWVRLLRDRYTTFDLAYELGEEETLLGAMDGV